MNQTGASMVRPTAILRRLLRCDNGAVTIDFVLLTAGVLILGIGVGAPIREGVLDMLVEINDAFLRHPTEPY